jgi:hypothetical protein
MSEENQRVSLYVLTKEKDDKDIKNAIAETEKELGVSSDSTVEESSERSSPDMGTFVVEVTKAFATAVVNKYGDRFVNWLSKKLSLNKNEGEKVVESKKSSEGKKAIKPKKRARKKSTKKKKNM